MNSMMVRFRVYQICFKAPLADMHMHTVNNMQSRVALALQTQKVYKT